MICASDNPKFFQSTKPLTVWRVARMHGSPPKTSGVLLIQLMATAIGRPPNISLSLIDDRGQWIWYSIAPTLGRAIAAGRVDSAAHFRRVRTACRVNGALIAANRL